VCDSSQELQEAERSGNQPEITKLKEACKMQLNALLQKDEVFKKTKEERKRDRLADNRRSKIRVGVCAAIVFYFAVVNLFAGYHVHRREAPAGGNRSMKN
jgi:hypothetical protein